MRQFPLLARLYIVSSYLGGMVALAWFVLSAEWQTISAHEWALGAAIGAVAAACQVFVVARSSTKGQRSDHLTPAPIFAAMLLLPRPVLALVLIFTWLPEWYFHRRSYFSQLWNIAAYLITGAIVRYTLTALFGTDQLHGSFSYLSLASLAVMFAMTLFLGLQNLMLAWVLKLARGQSFHDTGLFAPTKLLVEFGLSCVGLGFAICWLIDPVYGIAMTLPLALIFEALHVPNLKEEASTDPKTGLANMRHFTSSFTRDLERAKRASKPLTLLMCDLDYLRNINNTFGHQAGDVVLREVSEIIRRQVRGADIAARFGGEEFVILLSDTDRTDAQQMAERLRREIERARFDIGNGVEPIRATISIGLASFPHDSITCEGLTREADLAVYQAKRDGRNRVVVAGRSSRKLAGEWAREHLMPAPVADPEPAKQRPLWHLIRQITRADITVASPPTSEDEARPTTGAAPIQSRKRRRRRSDSGKLMYVIIASILSVGFGLLWYGIEFQPISWHALLFFVGLTVIAEQVAVDTFGRGKTSVAVVVKLCAALLFHEVGILATSLAAATAVGIRSQSALHRFFFNFGTFMLATEGAHATFTWLATKPLEQSHLLELIVPAVVAGLVFYSINHALLCLIRGLNERQSPWEIWVTQYRWLLPHYAILGALALVAALGYVAFGWVGLVMQMAPVVMIHVAIKQYVERSSNHVGELQQMNSRLIDSYEATLQALTRALDTRDEETEAHSQRVRRYTELIAQRLGTSADELVHISRGALLHDIGKIGVPDAILLKPGRLSEEERAIMRKHPEIGYATISHIPFLTQAAQVVLHHHEAFDGSGYPSQLSGANIPLGARIFAIADTFDAMTSNRPYRKALSVEIAIAEIKRCSGTQFDPEIVDVFLEIPVSELLAVANDIVVAPPLPLIEATPAFAPVAA